MGNKANGKRWKAARRKQLLKSVQNMARIRQAKKLLSLQAEGEDNGPTTSTTAENMTDCQHHIIISLLPATAESESSPESANQMAHRFQVNYRAMQLPAKRCEEVPTLPTNDSTNNELPTSDLVPTLPVINQEIKEKEQQKESKRLRQKKETKVQTQKMETRVQKQKKETKVQKQKKETKVQKQKKETKGQKQKKQKKQNPVYIVPGTAGDQSSWGLEGLRNYEESEKFDADNMPGTSFQYGNQDSVDDEIKIFCPKCNTEVSHTADGIQQDQTKILISKVYHYLEQEYEELKKLYVSLDLTPLSRLHQRTALATGVSETTVRQILKEEEERNADQQEEPPQRQHQARKRPRQAYSVQEDSSDDNSDYGEQSRSQHVSAIETLVVKVEPPENYEEPEIILEPVKVKSEPTEDEVNKQQGDPISVEVKAEPQDVAKSTYETLALDEPGTSKSTGRKRQRTTDVTIQQYSQGDTSATEASSSVLLSQELDESNLFGDREIKEEIEIQEEGFS